MRITSQTAERLIRRWGGLVPTQEKKKIVLRSPRHLGQWGTLSAHTRKKSLKEPHGIIADRRALPTQEKKKS